MPATKARKGFGTLLQRGDGAVSEAFTTIEEVRDINGPSKVLETDDATNMESPDGYVERIATIKDGGTVTFTVPFIAGSTTHALLDSDLESGRLANWRLIFSGATKRYSFAGYVTNLGAASPVKGTMTRDVTITLSGKPTLEAHS